MFHGNRYNPEGPACRQRQGPTVNSPGPASDGSQVQPGVSKLPFDPQRWSRIMNWNTRHHTSARKRKVYGDYKSQEKSTRLQISHSGLVYCHEGSKAERFLPQRASSATKDCTSMQRSPTLFPFAIAEIELLIRIGLANPKTY
ncbi:hypothetical protein DDT91_19750 [Algoriphagus sp. AK58]|nr:hypothetical protein [Algoriphagus sp. AK58]